MIRNLVIDSFLSFSGGFLAFFSPCILLVLLGFFAFVIGVTLAGELKTNKNPNIFPALFSVLAGLSVMFVVNFFPSELQRLHMKYYNPSAKIAGAVIFLFGLVFLEIFRAKLVLKEKKLTGSNAFVLGSYLFFGMALGIAWTHCLTPVLVKIISPAIQNPALLTRGFIMLWIYAFGLSIPLVSSGLLINFILRRAKFIKSNLAEIKVVNGLVLAIMGVALFNKPWWIYLSKILIGASHNSWKNQVEHILINMFK